MENQKSEHLVDLGAGDGSLSPKNNDSDQVNTPLQDVPDQSTVDQETTENASPLIASDSGFAEETLSTPLIFLHLCGQCPSLPSFQSDCLKVLTWLRASDIPFRHFNHKLNLDGRFPTIEIGNDEITNSDHILTDLSRHLNRALDTPLSVEQQILAFSLGSLIEHTLVREHREWFRANRSELLQAYSIDLKKSWKKMLPTSLLQFLFKRSSSKTLNTSHAMAADTTTVMTMLSKLLGTQNFFFGEDTVCSLDVVAFAILAPILAISQEVQYGSRDKIKVNCENLVWFVERMKQRLYPDWDKLCDGQKDTQETAEKLTDIDLNEENEIPPNKMEQSTMETAI
ncbi:failed axon connections isoform X2 [Aedes aegypti]|uniref:Uncharacterized protein n=1 Tax=Aedes aegypti TaxID=7159 RepID=A0A6I8U2Z9_AEDAE|nr:failed axon connections isoform X2 [Aedes aegypti]